MLQEKVAVVTGSGRGIGKAIAEQLSALGARVVVNDVDADVARETADGLPGDAVVHAANLLDDDAPDGLVATAVNSFGRLDIVVNNAGYTLDSPAHKMSDEWFREILEIHTVVPFKVIRAAAPHLREPAKRERAEGVEVFRKIVNISSIAAQGNPGQANYSAAKAGVVGLTRTLAKEWGGFKVNVNAVAYGVIDTRLTEAKSEQSTITVGSRETQVGIPEQTREMMTALIPVGRVGTAAEAAAPVVFFCSPASNYVSGQTLVVGGGLGMGMNF